MKTLCVIPARGGSHGVPGKNLRNVGGRPLIVWAIRHALDSQTPLRVIVSTDSVGISEVARELGAEVPFLRPAEPATDEASTEPTILHAIDWVRNEGWEPNLVVLLQATSPIRSVDSIDLAIAQLVAEGADSLLGVVPSSPFLWDTGDPPTAECPILRRPRRLDMTDTMIPLRETGSLYVTRTAIYGDFDNRIGGRVSLFVMDESEGLDIDTEIEMLLADRLLDQVGNHG